MDIAGELDGGTLVFLSHRLDVTVCLRMVASSDHQFCLWQFGPDDLECFDHQLQAFVSSPFAESENPMLGIAAAGEIRKFRPAGQDAMRAQVNVIAPVFFVQNFAIPRHEYRNRIREQQHSRRYRTSHAVQPRVANAGILQVHGVHQVMQGDVGVAAAQSRHERSEQPEECIERIAAEGAEEQIEPDDIRLQPIESFQDACRAGGVVERPAALHRETLQLRLRRGNLIRENGEAEKRISPQLFCNMKPILAEPALARRKSRDKADFHRDGALTWFSRLGFDDFVVGDVAGMLKENVRINECLRTILRFRCRVRDRRISRLPETSSAETPAEL